MAEAILTNQPAIKITKNGPYLVSGNVPLDEAVITPVGHHNEYHPGRTLPQSAEYHLCRCGGTKNPPFCDGTHNHNGFDGTEVADQRPFADRVKKKDIVVGTTMTLLDDERCAFARFCHRELGDVWNLTEQDGDPTNRQEAIIAASECPAGRLVEADNEGQPLEDQKFPEITVLQDPAKQVSGPLYVKGPVQVVGSEGVNYEVRNRQALCRCGNSQNKPFCDASHVEVGWKDSAQK
jgi:CDGSH-type Zn-finger protein